MLPRHIITTERKTVRVKPRETQRRRGRWTTRREGNDGNRRWTREGYGRMSEAGPTIETMKEREEPKDKTITIKKKVAKEFSFTIHLQLVTGRAEQSKR